MKTLLIPTDFDLKSLKCIPALAKRYYPQMVNIILVHMMKITDNMSELLMLSRRSSEYRHISSEFHNTCASLKQTEGSSINHLRIEFFYGSTVAVFKNFLEANGVDTIVVLDNYDYQMLNKNSITPALLINRSGHDLIHIDCNQPAQPEGTLIGLTVEEQSVL